MVKSAHARKSNDPGPIGRSRVGDSTVWRIVNRRVDALGVVVGDVIAEQTVQMPLIEHDHVVQQLSSDTSLKSASFVVAGFPISCSVGPVTRSSVIAQ